VRRTGRSISLSSPDVVPTVPDWRNSSVILRISSGYLYTSWVQRVFLFLATIDPLDSFIVKSKAATEYLQHQSTKLIFSSSPSTSPCAIEVR